MNPTHLDLPARAALEPFDGDPPCAADTRARALARLDGDEDFYARLAPLFRQSALEQARALGGASARGDAAQLRHWAHTLKGSLDAVGAIASAARAQRIEGLAREARLEEIGPLVAQLVAETAVIADQLSPAGA
jgi:HPt (histidine-containing phosphotransfer) domain-containing protein